MRFVTNNPRFSREFYQDKLNQLGIKAEKNEIITSGYVAANYLKDHKSYGKILLIGEKLLRDKLRNHNVQLSEDENADTVLVSFDTTFIYEDLLTAYRALMNGANFIATHPDMVCPTEDGGLIDSGFTIAALEASTGKKVEKIIGKPSSLLGHYLLEHVGVPAEQCIIVGDRLNTDVLLGKRTGMKAAWINTHNEPQPTDPNKAPDYIIRSIAELPNVINEKNG